MTDGATALGVGITVFAAAAAVAAVILARSCRARLRRAAIECLGVLRSAGWGDETSGVQND